MLLTPCAAGRQVLFALMLLLYLGLGELCVAHLPSLFSLTIASLCGAEMSYLMKETVNVQIISGHKWARQNEKREGLKD